MKLPPLNGLRAFEAAARHLSFKRAAEELHVTPTAISHQIQRLEAILQARLFQRHGRGLRLTREGEEYLPAVHHAFEELRTATDRVFGCDDKEVLKLRTLTYMGARWIVQRLHRFKARHPDIDVHITSNPGDVDFGNGEADLAIRQGNGHWPGLRAEWLMTQHCVPVLSPLLVSKPLPLTPTDLASLPLLHVASDPQTWERWFCFAGMVGVDVSRGLVFDQSITAIHAAIDGLGVAIGRTPFIQNELDAGVLVVPVPLYLPDERNFYIVAPEETAHLPKIRAFREWIRGEVRSSDSAKRDSNERPKRPDRSGKERRSRARIP